MDINGKTQILGIFGNPIGHTSSPIMHMSAINALKLNYVYVPFLVELNNLEFAVKAIRALNIKGVNITIPFKEKIIPYLDELDQTAEEVKAVNTVVNKSGKLVGYNTDGDGFIYDLKKNKIELKAKKIVLIGAGGAAKSIAISLLKQKPKNLILVNRTKNRLDALKKLLQTKTELSISTYSLIDPNIKEYLNDADIIINTTSLGMEPNIHESPIQDFSFIRRGQVFYDIIYKPNLTYFLKNAQEKGVLTINGLGMLIGQGAIAFQLFTGLEPPIGIMKKALLFN